MSVATLARRGDEAVGAALDRVFAAEANPWRHLGQLAFLFFVACVASGAYLYAVFDTSAAGAYASGRALEEGLAGPLLRGLHRYSADAFALFALLHLAREAARGHFRFHRAWSWLSGLVLVPLAWAAGITGYWLAWDARALYSALDVAEWMAGPPFGLAAFARDFIDLAALGDRFFSLVVFLHIGVPLFALAATWAHLQRLSHARAWPPAALAVPLLATLVLLAFVVPARSLGAADAFAVPVSLALDWFYFLPHALAAVATPSGLWAAVAGAGALSCALPWLPGARREPAARMDLASCNGCARCVADCPFGAVRLVPRSDGRPHPFEAHVDADLCAACGICAGACPSSSPFRRGAPPATGIDLPRHPIAALRAAMENALAEHPGAPLVFRCPHAARHPGALEVECVAMVPPAYVQFALRHGAAGVVLAGCRAGDCEHRLGHDWVHARFAGQRPPVLRAPVPRERVRVVACGADAAMLTAAVAAIPLAEDSPDA